MLGSEDLIGAVRASLTTLADQLEGLPAQAYREPAAELGGASIGQHVRHCLDHYRTVADNVDSGRFDYDERPRETAVERDRDRAAAHARELAARLGALRLPDLGRAVDVRTASSPDGDVAWQRSSLGRELQFLVSHTVHHSAMIAASCRVRGLPVPGECGVAPSTLRFRATSAR